MPYSKDAKVAASKGFNGLFENLVGTLTKNRFSTSADGQVLVPMFLFEILAVLFVETAVFFEVLSSLLHVDHFELTSLLPL